MALPPLSLGGVQDTVAVVFPAVALTPRGAEGALGAGGSGGPQAIRARITRDRVLDFRKGEGIDGS